MLNHSQKFLIIIIHKYFKSFTKIENVSLFSFFWEEVGLFADLVKFISI